MSNTNKLTDAQREALGNEVADQVEAQRADGRIVKVHASNARGVCRVKWIDEGHETVHCAGFELRQRPGGPGYRPTWRIVGGGALEYATLREAAQHVPQRRARAKRAEALREEIDRLVRIETAFNGLADLRKSVADGYVPTVGRGAPHLRRLRTLLTWADVPLYPEATTEERCNSLSLGA